MKIGITGATGILGARLTDYLMQKNLDIKVLIRNVSKEDAGRNNKIKKLLDSGIKIHEGSLDAPASLASFVKDMDVCIHLAAQVSFASAKKYRQSNVVGTKNLCNAIIENNPECRLIHCSTTGVLVMRKTLKFLNSEYTNSKYETEKVVDDFMSNKGLKSTIIYPCMIYGPGDYNFLPVLILYLQQKKIPLVSSGEKNFPAVYIDDLCELFHLASKDEKSIGKRYGTVKSRGMGIHDFIKKVALKAGCPLPSMKISRTFLMLVAILLKMIHYLFRFKGNPGLTKVIVEALSLSCKENYQTAYNDISWEPKIGVDEGLELTFNWMKSNELID